MSTPSRFLLGQGENLISNVVLSSGPPDKNYPYDFDEACQRMASMVNGTVTALSKLPRLARPADQVVAQLTIHPRGLAKSYHPREILSEFNLRQVGSRRVDITPDKDTAESSGELEATELFIAGKLDDFEKLGDAFEKRLPGVKDNKHGMVQLLEKFAAPSTNERTLIAPGDVSLGEQPFETVLHIERGRYQDAISNGFNKYAHHVGVKFPDRRSFQVGGLKFVPVMAEYAELEELAKFAFLRLLRPMPRLRSVDSISRSTPLAAAQNVPMPHPSKDPEQIRVAVFDGGLSEDSILKPYATSHETQGIGEAVPEMIAHGFDVTSAVLFGSLEPGTPAAKPAFHVDHYRVLDEDSKNDPFELYEVLGRIQSVLEEEEPKFVNLSLGPALPTDNHEVHAWTAVLDEYVSNTGALITVAGGNTGTKPWPESRIQVPGDSVNMLCVGAADTSHGNWSSAPYSSFGPGRRPGVIKPDLLGFGGTTTEPFIVYDQHQVNQVAGTAGTSFAAPSILRTAATIHSKFGPYVSPLATKALLINSAEKVSNHGSDRSLIGWGRAEANVSAITECVDGMVRVLYQGRLMPAKSVRAKIPIPHLALDGMVEIAATLCYLTPTDPEDPTSYTRAGLDVIFRPNVTKNPPGKKHANTESFFRGGDYESEADLRKAGAKWETVMHATKRKRGSGLVQPSFDIHYIPRSGGGKAVGAEPIQYAMVITVRSAKTPDLYERILREYQGVLAEVQPVAQLQLQVSS